MALQGTLDTFALADVLHLLAATKKTGCLRLEGTRGSGSVWVDSGEVVGISADHARHAVDLPDAMFELLRFEDGSFLFEADAHHSSPSSPVDVDSVLGAATVLLGEWREIEAVVPSLEARASLARSLSGDSVTISAAQWPALVALGGGTTVRALGEALGLGELPISRTVRDLIEVGVVELSSPAEAAPLEMAPLASVEAPRLERSPDPVENVEVTDEPTEIAPAPIAALRDEAETLAPEPAPLSAPPLAAPTEHGLPPVAWSALEQDDPDELPVARPIKARKARSKDAPGPQHSERFVPLDLPGHMSPATAAAAAADDESGQVDDLAAAFPGLSSRIAPEESDELARQLAALPPETAQAVLAAAEAETDEEREAALDAAVESEGGPINRGLLLKFLSSVKS